jgi:iron-sulfur cluster repair protein YtfE (RIC family)
MLTRIGKQAVAGDAVDLLLDCHERIRSFLALARRVAEAPPSDPGVGEAALRVRRYFVEALPLHARDEDESLLPRLRGRDAAVDAELDAMSREHREHEAPLAALVAACERIGAAPERLADVAPQLSSAVAELERHFVPHLRREEAVIFPAMRRLLDREEDAAIVRELRARRSPAARAEPAGDPR